MNRIFIFLLCFFFGSAKIRIKELDVPPSVESGTVEDVILDCEYEVIDDSEIEVKWYFRNDTNIIYQWIPGKHLPQAMGAFKDLIDAKYKISSNKNTMYRALHIINVTPELTGNYSCKVSGINSEDVQTKPMVIYDPADTDLELEISEEDSLINCTVGGVFPEPEMRLYIFIDKPENETDEILFEEDDELAEFDEDDGTFNVTSILVFDPSNITGPFTYVCELTIPGTNYSLRAENTYELEENEPDQVEEQIEDYLNSVNLTDSEETLNETQEISAEFETQIEEGVEIINAESGEDDDSKDTDKKENNDSDDGDDDDDDNKESGAAICVSNIYLLTILGLLALFKTL